MNFNLLRLFATATTATTFGYLLYKFIQNNKIKTFHYMKNSEKAFNEQPIQVFSNESQQQFSQTNSQSLDLLPLFDVNQRFGTYDCIEDKELSTNTTDVFELHKYVKDFCFVCEDSQLWVGSHKRLSFGPIDIWTQRRSITSSLELLANGLKPVKGSANKFTVNQIGANDVSVLENETQIQFTNRNGFCGQFPISEDCKIIATSKDSQLFILTLPYVETEEVIGIRPNDGFVLIHSNLSVFNSPKPLAKSQINCDINDNNNNELKPYYKHSENGHLFILGEGGHLLLIDKRHNPYVNDSFECVLLVGSGGLDLFSLYDLRSFPRISGNPYNENNSSDGQKGRNISSNNCMNRTNSLSNRSKASSSADSTNTERQVKSFGQKRQSLEFDCQIKRRKFSYSPSEEYSVKD
jgi:hypothetical protein